MRVRGIDGRDVLICVYFRFLQKKAEAAKQQSEATKPAGGKTEAKPAKKGGCTGCDCTFAPLLFPSLRSREI